MDANRTSAGDGAASGDTADARAAIVEACLAMGFAAAGVCEARPSDFSAPLHEWLSAGKQGEMDWLRDTADVRLSIDRFLSDAKSVIVVADQYAMAGDSAGVGDEGMGSPTGRLARYAVGTDYHKVVSKRLHRLSDALRERFPSAQFRTFVDAAPVMEREHAVRAGLGWMGKHTLLIRPGVGSYMLLGGIATTLEIAGETATSSGGGVGFCGACTRCIDACPTHAITERSVDATKCISYLTIERETPIEPAMHGLIGDWLLGCDICQEVCPFNQPERSTEGRSSGRIHPAYSAATARIPARVEVLDILGWDADARAERLSSTAVKRATLDVLKRNALIVLGNRLLEEFAELRGLRKGPGDVETKPGDWRSQAIGRIQVLAVSVDEPELVRVTANQVLGRLAEAGAV